MDGYSASVFVCDEMLFTLTGKLLAQGIYSTGDIAITTNEHRSAQLVFVFTIDCPIQKLLSSVTLKLKVLFPGQEPHIMPVQMQQLNPILFSANPQRRIVSFKYPMLIQQPLLKPGPIHTSVAHDGGIIDAGIIWVTSLAEDTTGANRSR